MILSGEHIIGAAKDVAGPYNFDCSFEKLCCNSWKSKSVVYLLAWHDEGGGGGCDWRCVSCLFELVDCKVVN